jgi:hypothetical protein
MSTAKAKLLVEEAAAMTDDIKELSIADLQRVTEQLQASDERIVDRAAAMRIAERMWWRTKLGTPEGLAHLFPGLKPR